MASTRPYADQVAVVTGGSAGIGRAIALRLAEEGMRVAVTGRREDKLQELEGYPEGHGRIFPYVCDMTKEQEVVDFFKKIKEKFSAIHVLVNNAGTALYTKVADCEMDKWRNMFELNVLGVGVASREALKLMKETNVEGYIINISSISAHGVPTMVGKHVYNASKHALRLITEGLRAELTEQKSNIRVSMISPGSVATEIAAVGGWLSASQDDVPAPTLKSEDIGSNVIYLLNLPSSVHITDLVVRPTGETVLA
ncbi:dehydrogenase/reductase SDR family member 11 [Halyomorpha halys]|uniref:dehydrogenase/reductase SDR family member 11 n=1 Tax=Halyomorpha halys TaxID=286706 RepID=UPI0006D4E06B|nr:dehydrogenase/reductase SDR family member 11-like [Halyomorpha halys]